MAKSLRRRPSEQNNGCNCRNESGGHAAIVQGALSPRRGGRVPYWKAWEAFEFYGPPRWLTLPSWQVPGWQPREISERCRDVYRVLWDLGPQSCGKTERCGYARAAARAREFAEQWNSAGDVAEAEQLISSGSA